MKDKKILIMGVSGTGKSLIGQLIAQSLNIPFLDGDDFHSEYNLDKMSRGVPLTDNDRVEWLKILNHQFIYRDSVIIACSALKPEYRYLLRNENEDLITIYLQGSFSTILDRYQKRVDHFFCGEKMLKSQFDTLIEPATDEAVFVDVDQSVEIVVAQALRGIAQWHNKSASSLKLDECFK